MLIQVKSFFFDTLEDKIMIKNNCESVLVPGQYSKKQ